PWTFTVTSGAYYEDGSLVFSRAPDQVPPPCNGTVGVRLLAPGAALERTFTWNGTYQDDGGAWIALDGGYYADIRAAYGWSEADAGSLSARGFEGVYVCGTHTCPS
ncbi:MAG: hypothetical protein ABR562_08915, partial [Thermoplasmatota archaeon]|nr:hypothetical protein [Halobacteriales archaeon]